MRTVSGAGHDSAPMQSSLLDDDDLPDAAAVAAAVAHRGTPGQFDELRAALSRGAPLPSGDVSALWRAFFSSLGPDGWADLRSRQLRVQQRVREDGAIHHGIDCQTGAGFFDERSH